MIGDWSLRARTSARLPGAFGEAVSMALVERFNLPDTLQVTGRVDDLRPFISARSGCTLADETGRRRFSGPLTQLVRNGNRTCTLTWTSDLIWLWDRVAYPLPGAAITGQTIDYDVRTGAAETVVLAYINANAGPGAVVTRRIPGLTVPSSAGRGGTVKITARLDVLGTLAASIAEAAGLRIQVLQSSTNTLPVLVTTVPDLSTTIGRYGAADSGGPGVLQDDWVYTIDRPTVTDSIAAGGGEGAARIFREKADLAAEVTWGRIEHLVDQRQTTDTGELDQAAVDDLTAGAQPVEIRATVLDSPDLRIGVDVPIGALVSLDLDGERVVDRLRQVTTTITVQDGSPTVQVVPVIGNPDAGLTRDQRQFITLRRQLRKVITR